MRLRDEKRRKKAATAKVAITASDRHPFLFFFLLPLHSGGCWVGRGELKKIVQSEKEPRGATPFPFFALLLRPGRVFAVRECEARNETARASFGGIGERVMNQKRQQA
ncbi:hypothetical protein, unlikely [Trypanosoma brucei gambiense DAL972]|uniref:Uncharacterized protein n=1 Tax=Trypanosoma brucei gambiense (strain MHOM/CI/86/DAL972) TaxID=679716 RepID=D0A9N6_TRYB9|nr:hypothetical protein, unlikely [Trypanosoma brucei gambiense DAL972]CBH18387.1 hypothetical protein, unlikely [Trypanosoma brucei gambiense DAL972]|eukprot:XP_011780651.1 hypothetical protein, unlikely [Trypanosoma brucei gambiense DAL972]